MEAKDVIERLLQDLATTKASGQSEVSIDSLTRYLGDLQRSVEPSTEARRMEQQRNLARYDAEAKSNLEMFKSVIESGKEALNASMLINGGALVALLGFLGAVVSKGQIGSLGLGLTGPLKLLGAGVLLTALAFGLRYLTQLLYSDEKTLRWGIGVHVLTIVLAVGAYVVFGMAIWTASDAFAGFFGTAPALTSAPSPASSAVQPAR